MSEEAEFNNPNFTDGARSAFNFDKGECAKILLEAGVAFDEEDAKYFVEAKFKACYGNLNDRPCWEAIVALVNKRRGEMRKQTKDTDDLALGLENLELLEVAIQGISDIYIFQGMLFRSDLHRTQDIGTISSSRSFKMKRGPEMVNGRAFEGGKETKSNSVIIPKKRKWIFKK